MLHSRPMPWLFFIIIIMKTIPGFKDTFSTDDLGWPVKITYVLVNEKIFLSLEESIDMLGIKAHVQARGWQKVESFIAQQGVKDGFIENGLKKSLISHAAFITILFSFPCGNGKTENVQQEGKLCLKLHLLDKLHAAERSNNCKTPSPKRINIETTPSTPNVPTTNTTPVHPGSTPLSAIENISPVKHLLYSPLKQGKTTSELFSKERASHEHHQHGRRWKSRPLINRVRVQEGTLTTLSRRVHRGSKEDFLSAFACSVVKEDNKTQVQETGTWNGKFTHQDIIHLTKLVHSEEKKESLYDTLTTKHAAERHHISANQILQVEDNCSAADAVDYVRRTYPGLICSSYAVDTLKSKLKKECEAVLLPERCPTGWRIQPNRLHSCLQFVYPWLQQTTSEWWKLYGDARTFGRQKSVAFAIGNLNNEHVLNGCSYQSPSEMWPLCVFYGGDSRLNLELNLQDDSPWLRNWVSSMETVGHSVYVSGDSMFLDAMADVQLDPTSRDHISIYNYETVDTKAKVGSTTGMRSGLGRKIVRELPHSILKGLPAERYVLCCDHMMTRITECLLSNKVKSLYDMEAKSLITKRERDNLVQRLESNINTRGVRGGNFKFMFEAGKNKLQQVSLNKSAAQLISAPPSFFKESSYPHILDGVSKDITLPKPLPPALQQALQRATSTISEYECETLIWEHHFKMHEICRMDPLPILVDKSKDGSLDPSDYIFGVTDEKVHSYVTSADIFHGLMCFRYGSDALTPYMMKCLDIVPIFLKSLPFRSVMRMSTEGGERMHYMHQQRFFQHSSRGGGWNYQDPLLGVFHHMYRQIWERVHSTTPSNVKKFEEFVLSCLEGTFDDGATPVPEDCPADLGPFRGKRFALVGSLASFKLNHDKLRDMILNLGGQVLNITTIPDELPVDVIVISTQKECDKASSSPGITTSVQRNWTIVSPLYVMDTQQTKAAPVISEKYLLSLDKIRAAPGTAAVHTTVRTVADTRFKRCGAFKDLKQTLHCRAKGIERQPKQLTSASKRSHHKKRSEPLRNPPSSFAMFVKEMSPIVSARHSKEVSFKELQSILLAMYQSLSSEAKDEYRKKGLKHFEEMNRKFV